LKNNTSIKIKAAFLLLVFAMNTVLGFACALGVDMGFNSKHHHDDEEATKLTVHVHLNGKKHVHEHQEKKGHLHSHEAAEKDSCCTDGVVKLQSLDKSISSNANRSINPPVFVTIIPGFYNPTIFKYSQVPAQKHLPSFFHPPPPDIRILIQSFQI